MSLYLGLGMEPQFFSQLKLPEGRGWEKGTGGGGGGGVVGATKLTKILAQKLWPLPLFTVSTIVAVQKLLVLPQKLVALPHSSTAK